jgi:hypothetical protein
LEEVGPSHVTTPEDPANWILTTVSELRHQANVREEMLDDMSTMVNFRECSQLVDTIRTALGNPIRVIQFESKVHALQLKREQLQKQIRNQENQIREAKARALALARAIAEVKETLTLVVDVVNKARLFHEKLEKEDHLFKSRIIRFLVDQAHKMESVLDRMRTLVDNIGPDPPVTRQEQSLPVGQTPQEASNRPGGTPPLEGNPEGRKKFRKRQVVTSTNSDSSEHRIATLSPV